MKLKFNVTGKCQADPFIFADGDKLYLYVTAQDGVEAYSATDLFGEWKYEGVVGCVEGWHDYWAPSVIKYEDKYYIYVSCATDGKFEYMHVMESDSPLGPFGNGKCLYDFFSIDSHIVRTDAGLFLWFAKNNTDCARKGTRIYVDKMLDPYTPEHKEIEMIVPTFDEEFFTPQCTETDKWHTIEGPFWLEKDGYRYVMYSGGCYQDDTYHIGYAYEKTDEQDHTRLNLTKKTNGDRFAPVIIKNSFEEGTGHHSVIKYKGEWYAVYHARDYEAMESDEYSERRTARVCKLHIENGEISAERYEDRV